jgi:hypothetical protein
VKIRAIISTAISTWFVGLILAILLIGPALEGIILVLRSIFWVMGAFQSVLVGTPMPEFWSD